MKKEKKDDVIQGLPRWVVPVLGLALLSLLFGSLMIWRQRVYVGAPISWSLDTQGAVSSSIPMATVMVHVAGAVQSPGVYDVAAGLRVMRVIDIAGGALPGADLDKVNLAASVKDGSRVWVPFQKGVKGRMLRTVGANRADIQVVHLNQATVTQLAGLPGIGRAIAQRVVNYRETHGPFRSCAQIQDVKGIGPRSYERLAPYLRL